MPVPRHPSDLAEAKGTEAERKGKEKRNPPSQPTRQETTHHRQHHHHRRCHRRSSVREPSAGCYHPPNVLQPIRRFCSSRMTFLLSSNRYTRHSSLRRAIGRGSCNDNFAITIITRVLIVSNISSSCSKFPCYLNTIPRVAKYELEDCIIPNYCRT